ncbi:MULTISPECIES: PIN domain-containing protein [Acidobacterium]|uniref:PIN domain-containing protein n=1 Tax=Acidobacterium capsulatum (strain ATCC 51196 / DSM 11244 / BCRC 80197 / JCM 7670 / NBRC 15755 / NCIMB 13165 / 161) TaxID=240015 RepID=C1F2G9_ACIC5|nr:MULTISPECIES: PIN domain-containing protein [Acidobacterium]ACO31947.1 conserved hypothetical protein [Acidobacterium capsulatum ATCC 51196]HCT60681.1 nucleotide-binding protein [Acidobacterium sp.]
MTERKRLVLDANILLRAAFGVRVRSLLEAYEDAVLFFTPDVCISDARQYIPALASKRGIDAAPGLAVLDKLAGLIEIVNSSLYESYETQARERMQSRDMEDWPIVAASLLLQCPIWTEDQDFFGSGVSIWTTRTIEVYLRDA